jgi:hypothetical protein
MSENHDRFKFSATCETDDLGVLHCLRSIVQLVEDEYPQIGWGGTGRGEWQADRGQVTFRFTSAARRDEFLVQAGRLINGSWSLVRPRDPAGLVSAGAGQAHRADGQRVVQPDG